MTTLRTPLALALGLLLTSSFVACSSAPPGEEEDTDPPKRSDAGSKSTASATKDSGSSSTNTNPPADVPVDLDAGSSTDDAAASGDGAGGTAGTAGASGDSGTAGTAGNAGTGGTGGGPFTGRCTPQAGSGQEAEPNDSVAAANPWDPTKEFFGRITPATDKDFVKFTFPANATRWQYQFPCLDLPNPNELQVFVNGNNERVNIDAWRPVPGTEYVLELATTNNKQTSYRFKMTF
ncbi:MAG: hypothetical protein U0169_18765 [Polyangiaceae bacterium]